MTSTAPVVCKLSFVKLHKSGKLLNDMTDESLKIFIRKHIRQKKCMFKHGNQFTSLSYENLSIMKLYVSELEHCHMITDLGQKGPL